jgi:hypothetical protein
MIVKTKRKTEINLEVEEAIAIRTRRSLLAYCPQCQRQMRMVAADDAALVAHCSAREIYRLVENGGLHYAEDPRGLLYICRLSLEGLLKAGTPVGENRKPWS